MLSTRIEQWETDILEKGIEKGEGTLLLKILALKYGPLPERTKERVSQANTHTIERWAAKMLTVSSLAEVFDKATFQVQTVL